MKIDIDDLLVGSNDDRYFLNENDENIGSNVDWHWNENDE